jgi:hypothetical protein
MDVPDSIPEIGGFSNDGGFVPVLEKMPHTFVPLIEIHGISRHKALHERRKTPLIAPQQQVKMVRHQRPCEAAHPPPAQIGSDPFKEGQSIVIILENFPFLDAPGINVMDCAGKIHSWTARHAPPLINFRAKNIW